MSASNAAAKKRRAMIPSNSGDSVPNIGGRPYVNSTQQIPVNASQKINAPSNAPQTPQQGFTLQQVISVIDKRLVNLEINISELNKKHVTEKLSSPSNITNTAVLTEEQIEFNNQTRENFQMINENMNEYDNRFEILINEIADIKSVVLKLQTYTMDVNKMLLDERQQNTVENENNKNNDTQPLILNDSYSFSNNQDVTYTLLPTTEDKENNNSNNDSEVNYITDSNTLI